MKIAVTDACIFIDIHVLKLTQLFFSLPFDIHSTVDVFNELYEDHKAFLQAFISVKKLTLHVLTAEDRQSVIASKFPLSLSEADRSVVFVANRLKATILSSDKAVRKYAKSISIPCHGMLWIFDRLVEAKVLKPEAAKAKLNELISHSIMYQNNAELLDEALKRMESW
jgi:predicted nucleic acid-binding protein